MSKPYTPTVDPKKRITIQIESLHRVIRVLDKINDYPAVSLILLARQHVVSAIANLEEARKSLNRHEP